MDYLLITSQSLLLSEEMYEPEKKMTQWCKTELRELLANEDCKEKTNIAAVASQIGLKSLCAILGIRFLFSFSLFPN